MPGAPITLWTKKKRYSVLRQINTIGEGTPCRVLQGIVQSIAWESTKQEVSIVYVQNIFIIIGVQKYLEVNGIKYYGGIQQKTEDRQFTHISD